MIISHFPGGGSGGEITFGKNIKYTGLATYLDDGDGNYRVRLLTSGTLTVKQDTFVDIFAVGGGGNGGNGESGTSGGGGGGGYTVTATQKSCQ